MAMDFNLCDFHFIHLIFFVIIGFVFVDFVTILYRSALFNYVLNYFEMCVLLFQLLSFFLFICPFKKYLHWCTLFYIPPPS
jgi:hypothetical protein